MTFKLAYLFHLFIPAVIFTAFCSSMLLFKFKYYISFLSSFLIFWLFQTMSIYFIDYSLVHFILAIIIQLFICYLCFYDNQQKRYKIALIFMFIQLLSYMLTSIPLSFLYSVTFQVEYIFDREFTIYAAVLYDMWLLGLSYFCVAQMNVNKHKILLFKYLTLPICQLVFAFIIFLMIYDLDLSFVLMIMFCVISVIIITNVLMIKASQQLSDVFLQRYELTKMNEIKQQEKELNQLKEEIHQDIDSMETLLRYHLHDDAQEYLQKQYSRLKEMNIGSYCDHRMVDLVLHKKVALMKEKGIDEKLDVYVREDIDIEDIDLVSLLFNVIDNAIEACEEISFHRFIYIKMYEKYNCFYLEVINSKDPQADHSDLKTTKKDSLNHGIGISIIQNIVKKYKGDVFFEDNKNTFRVKLFLKNR